MQITAPFPILYLPENLWSFFTKPGRELLIRVLNIEQKTLYLELGGEKFQARIGGTLTPEDFTIGEVLRVRIERIGNPIVLKIISPKKASGGVEFLYLLTTQLIKKPINKENLEKDINLLAVFIKNILISKKEKETSHKELGKILGEKIKNYDFIYKDNKIIIPFIFNDERSWGYLEIDEPKEEHNKIRLFHLKMFFEYLGLVECFLSYANKKILMEFYFTNKDAFELAKRRIKKLEDIFKMHKILAKINIYIQEILPGQLLEREG